jgi:rfaE bifunctional protein nucleotidyltransferase chain/domain
MRFLSQENCRSARAPTGAREARAPPAVRPAVPGQPTLPGFDLRGALCHSSGRRLKTKILSLSELSQRSDEIRQAKQRLVLTNGCFDLLHVGHVRYLKQARELGDFLAVAVNGDESVRSLKGTGRPLNSAEDRAEVLAALECVDFVTIFSPLRATQVIEALQPAIYVKGGDYTLESLDPEEVAALKDAGAEIKTLPLVPGKSTSRLIERMQQP